MWCGRAGVVGVVGAALLLLGLTQIVSGIYFMLMMPIFQLGSNIWTGTWKQPPSSHTQNNTPHPPPPHTNKQPPPPTHKHPPPHPHTNKQTNNPQQTPPHKQPPTTPNNPAPNSLPSPRLSPACAEPWATIGWTGQTMRRGQMVLVATLSVLVTNVANLVIIQVGENGVFLSESDVRAIVGNNQETTMLIAFWLTTVVTAMGIVVSFFGAQYLFCVVVRGPRVKGRMPVTRSLSEEDLHHRQEGGPDAPPPLEDVLALPDPAGSSAWSFAVRRDASMPDVYPARPSPVVCPELPFSTLSSQYARPNARRIHRSNSVSGRLLLGEDAGAATLSRKFHACSLDDLDAAPVIEVGTFPRDRSVSEQSLVSSFQELPPGGGLAAHVHRAASVQERLLDGKKVLTSFGPVSRPAVRVVKPKGPAPPPPIKPKPKLQTTPLVHRPPQDYDDEEPRAARDEDALAYDSAQICAAEIAPEPPVRTESLLRDAHPGIAKRITALERALPLPVIEENIKNTRKRPAPQPRSILPPHSDGESSREASLTRPQDRRPPKPESAKPPKPEAAKPPRPEARKPPRSSLLEKPPRLAGKNTTLARPGAAAHAAPAKPERKRAEGDSAANLRRLEEVLTNILDHGAPPLLRATKSDENIAESAKAADAKAPKGILKKGPRAPSKPSKYEVAHREALEDSRALLERLPRGELQRNKIVLRVPSFRTAGCQTEAYPVRRRASCAQTNLSVAPRYRTDAAAPPRWGKGGRREEPQAAAATDGSSSSGYSSPEVSSKEPSPPHSGPPSPASSSAAPSDEDERRCGDANVTVIEINKGDAAGGRARAASDRPPPRPPKPLRLRHMSDAAALVSSQGGLLVPVHRRTAPLPLYEDVFGLAALTENVMLLTEAINPVLTLQAPTWDGRTAALPRPRPALRTHSLSLPRPSVTPTGRPHASRGSRSPSPVRREEQRQQAEKQSSASSTAAYLASLELLASHYRHQALANAKQLQLQQRLLMQQQQQHQEQHEQQEQQEAKLKEESEEVSDASPPSETRPTSASTTQTASESLSPIEQESEC
ncbi:hypothetical protein C7M84_001676 [Penaeus vannamei]|uniref:Uncharacterized protein n=1 Tax=Penaeus vannamei TaxID=6689 RepID=A0A3R7N7X3_PENVA|nr:hypothetical protein C7M84_001676 [Penaeus vannamei]